MDTEQGKRESLGTRLGFLLVSAGCAIGLGNIWKFPWMVGQYGGATFVVLYFLFLALLGLPILTMEFATGRAAKTSPLRMHEALVPGRAGRWAWHGTLCFAANYMLMMFYTTVCGWMFLYAAKSAAGSLGGLSAEQVGRAFDSMLGSPAQTAGAMAFTVTLAFLILSRGLQSGLERVTKAMMLVLLLMIVLLAVHCATLPGASDGLRFYLRPSLEPFRDPETQAIDLGRVGGICVAAMNQAFFTLSIGIGAMAIFGSYIGRGRTMPGEALCVTLLDTFVAVFSGLIIFPACFAFNGGETGDGPGLIFVTLPSVFNAMPGGRVLGILFFIFMVFAAFSTVLAVCENIVAMSMERMRWSRARACIVSCIAMLVLSLPCALSFNLLSGIHPFGGSSGILDLEDFLVSNLALPVGAIAFILFCTRRSDWGWENFIAEANEGSGLKAPGGKVARFYAAYVLPLVVLFVFLVGIWGKIRETLA